MKYDLNTPDEVIEWAYAVGIDIGLPGAYEDFEETAKFIVECVKLRQRCDYFDITTPLLSGERLSVKLTWLDRIKK